MKRDDFKDSLEKKECRIKKKCGFAICGLIIKIFGFAICGLAHLKKSADVRKRNKPPNLRIRDVRIRT